MTNELYLLQFNVTHIKGNEATFEEDSQEITTYRSRLVTPSLMIARTDVKTTREEKKYVKETYHQVMNSETKNMTNRGVWYIKAMTGSSRSIGK